MKSKADKLLEQLQEAPVAEKLFWGFDGDLLDGKATWNEAIDNQECVVRLTMIALADLEDNNYWSRPHYMRGIYLSIYSHGATTLREFKMRQAGNKATRSYIYVPCLRTNLEKIQATYNDLFMKAKAEGTRGLGFPGTEWEYSRFLS